MALIVALAAVLFLKKAGHASAGGAPINGVVVGPARGAPPAPTTDSKTPPLSNARAER